tara:strand:+ start:3220 stop:3516 length:297 start_codon:yes stop_codon:yes gene_type:complete
MIVYVQAYASTGGLNASGVAYIVDRDAAGIDKVVSRPGIYNEVLEKNIKTKRKMADCAPDALSGDPRDVQTRLRRATRRRAGATRALSGQDVSSKRHL